MVDDGINTSNNNNNNNNPEGEDREINLYAVFFKYMVYWPWFVASVIALASSVSAPYVFLTLHSRRLCNVTNTYGADTDEAKAITLATNQGQ